jgi:hypothetical protein
MVSRGSIIAGCICLGILVRASAQETTGIHTQSSPADSIHNRNSLALLFDNSFNTYHWNGGASYQNFFGPLFCSLNEQFLSSVIRTDRTYITDQEQFDLVLRRRISTLFSGIIKTSAFILSDDRSINLGKTSTESMYGGVEYRPMFQFLLEPLIGVDLDRQTDQTDKGISYILNTSLDTVDYNGYKTALAGKWKYDQIIPRRADTRNLFLTIDKNFFEETRNSLQIFYSYLRRDIYIPADLSIQQRYNVVYNIESRKEDLLGFVDTLGYTVNDRMFISVTGTMSGREIGRETLLQNIGNPEESSLPTTVDEFQLESSARVDYRPFDIIHTWLRFDYIERDERHTLGNPGVDILTFNTFTQEEERKNNHSRRTGLAGNISFDFSRDNSLSLSGSGNLLRYDTPSLENDDDRDELWYVFNLNGVHRINRYLVARIAGDVNMMHLVYIASTRSANNTWNRIIRLAPSLDYAPSNTFMTSNVFEVLANYTAYDYEFLSSPIQSFAYRQFSWHDSSSYALTRKIMFVWLHQIKFYEQGQLQWNDFSERPVNYFEDKLYTLSVRYTVRSSLLFSVGFRYFSQLRYSYQDSQRYIDHFLRSIGPSTEIEWIPDEYASFSLKGWYETQHQTGEPDRAFANMSMNLIVHI